MKKFIRGFSLIELMVVIAIIALLSAVAVPAYNQYVAKAKLAAALHATESLRSQITSYYNQYGIFPNASELGYEETAPGSGNILNPETINPAIQTLQVSRHDTSCGETVGTYSVMMSGAQLSLDFDYAVAQAFYSQDGVIKSMCAEADNSFVSHSLYCSKETTYSDFGAFLGGGAQTLLCN